VHIFERIITVNDAVQHINDVSDQSFNIQYSHPRFDRKVEVLCVISNLATSDIVQHYADLSDIFIERLSGKISSDISCHTT
jgi:hypothetical protein